MSFILARNVTYMYPDSASILISSSSPDSSKLPAVYPIQRINFQLAQGTCTGILGTPGAGKSTLLQLLAGTLVPIYGTISINGTAMWTQSSVSRQLIATNRPFPISILPSYTWSDICQIHKVSYRIPDETYVQNMCLYTELFHLHAATHTPISEMNIGLQFRYRLAATLLHGPSVLLLDEPFAALDTTDRSIVQNALQYLQTHRKMSIVVTSGQVLDFLPLCTDVMILDHGQMIGQYSISTFQQLYNQYCIITMHVTDSIYIPDARVSVLADGPTLSLLVNLNQISISEILQGISRISFISQSQIAPLSLEQLITQIQNKHRAI